MVGGNKYSDDDTYPPSSPHPDPQPPAQLRTTNSSRVQMPPSSSGGTRDSRRGGTHVKSLRRRSLEGSGEEDGMLPDRVLSPAVSSAAVASANGRFVSGGSRLLPNGKEANFV